ncbi:helix-turn-helix transcriptional regulator [Candidatus Roizmanbacteria bacterium]|nr:helix-turn-helix transcriptional regulator [Candidatus Roizmanbacteria bacterium]
MPKIIVYRKLGEAIASYRHFRNLSQEQLAFVVGIDRTYLARIEVGRANPSLKVLHKVALELEVPLNKLLELK